MAAKEISSAQLDRIESAILGNGHEGLIARTARIEENLETVGEAAKGAKEAAERANEKAEISAEDSKAVMHKLELGMTKLESTVINHIGTDHLSVLMKKKQFWAIVIFGFISLHLIATYVPNVWDWIVVLLGIPKLVIPIG